MNVSTPDDTSISMTCEFRAPPIEVFGRWINPSALKQWMFGPDEWPLVACRIDPVVDGTLRLVWRHAHRGDMALSGRYLVVDPPRRLVHTELFDEDWTHGETYVTTDFKDLEDSTLVVMNVAYANKATRDRVLQSGMTDGVANCFKRLAHLLAVEKK